MMGIIWAWVLSPLWAALSLSMIVAIGAFALAWFMPAWFPPRFRNTAIGVGIGALVVGGFYWWAFHAGEQHMMRLIAAKDAAAIQRVQRATHDVDACYNRGGNWDASTGTCN